MKNMKLIKLFSLYFLVSISITSCQITNNSITQDGKIAVADFEKQLNANLDAQLIDVRTPEEFNEGHLFNAKNINIKADDFEDQLKKLDKTKPTFVYCHSGHRSGSTYEKMKGLGFEKVFDLKGGIIEWQNANKPLSQKTN